MLINNKYLKLIRFDKPVGSYLLLWPVLTALWIANKGMPPITLIIIFTVGVFIMRSVGCILNDLADIKFDKHVERTKDRPLTSGDLSVKQALIFLVTLLFIALMLAMQLNWLAISITPLALGLTTLYPFCKRFTYWPQIILGLTFNLGILMAFAASINQIPITAILLYAIAVLWTLAFDTVYAMSDMEDDIKIGVKSSALKLGKNGIKFVVTIQTIIMLGLMALGFITNLSWPYFVSLMMSSLTFIYQYKLCRQNKFHQAFINNHISWLIVFIGVIFSYSLI